MRDTSSSVRKALVTRLTEGEAAVGIHNGCVNDAGALE